jgi:hypothetical protein
MHRKLQTRMVSDRVGRSGKRAAGDLGDIFREENQSTWTKDRQTTEADVQELIGGVFPTVAAFLKGEPYWIEGSDWIAGPPSTEGAVWTGEGYLMSL